MAHYSFDFSKMSENLVRYISSDSNALPSARRAAKIELEHREHPWATQSQAERIVSDHERNTPLHRTENKTMARKGYFGHRIEHVRNAKKGHRGGHRYGGVAQTTKGLGPRHKVSRAKDGRRKAMLPGWRRSKSGKVYFENRINRSDHRPGRKSPWKL